ncbi:hypothetical protein EV652_107305 [Kribbella steppae]|uniref:HEAT repeat domain-containing protein n=1 Tax=Kribbella steppae TaxID=2512223 RepID=A0A4R2HHH3_9ACTN|nr:hypothetical protein [Kribbella steppae]TCO26413.1 hypothetical protein EV652_107305 [Kribbella steppae]
MPDYFASRKLLLELQSHESEVAVVADKLGWGLLGVLQENPAGLDPYEVIWGKSAALTLHYREDFLTKSPCAFVTGADERQVHTAARLVEARLKPATLDDLLEAADALRHIPADFALAVLRLGLGSPESFDERFATRIAEAAEHPQEEMRKAAAWATSYMIWTQFIQLLDQLAEHDPSDDVRRVARNILNAYLADSAS